MGARGTGGLDGYLVVEFSAEVNVNGFRTKAHSGWDGSAFKNYRFEKGEADGTWTLIQAGQGINQDCCEWQEISVCETTGKVFRLYMVDDYKYGYHALEQLEFHIKGGYEPLCDLGGGKWTSLVNTKITASSSWDRDYLPGNIKTSGTNPWHAARGTGGMDDYLVFEFAYAVTVNGFRTKAHSGWDGSAFKNYWFEVSEDGVEWTMVQAGQGINQDCCEWQEISVCETTGKLFRLYMVDDYRYGYHSLEEMEFHIKGAYEPTCDLGAGEWTELVNTKITASSSWDRDYLPGNIKISGTNPWHAARGTGGMDDYLVFEFNEAVTVNGFRTKAHTGWDGSAFNNYVFETSTDGATWTMVQAGQGINQDCCEWQEISVCETTSKYFRLYMVDDYKYGY